MNKRRKTDEKETEGSFSFNVSYLIKDSLKDVHMCNFYGYHYCYVSDYFYFVDWFKAVQGLMSCAVASSLLSLLIGLLSLCWSSKGCNAYQATGAFANLTCTYEGRHLKTKYDSWALQLCVHY